MPDVAWTRSLIDRHDELLDTLANLDQLRGAIRGMRLKLAISRSAAWKRRAHRVARESPK